MPEWVCERVNHSLTHSLTRIPSHEPEHRVMIDEILDSVIMLLLITFSMLLFAGFISECISEGSTGSFLKIARIAIITVPFSR